MSSVVCELTDQVFKSEVLESNMPVLVDFWASWCGPCKMMAPVVDAAAEKYAEKMKVAKINVDENGQTAAEYGVMSIPTLLIFKEGEVVGRVVGFRPKEELYKTIDGML